MRLNYITKEALEDLKLNFFNYKKHYLDEGNEWFIKHLEEIDGLRESKIECEEFELDYNENYEISDLNNVKIIYENLKHISPSQATDEKLWAGLLHTQFWKYIKYRRKKEIESGDEEAMKTSFFFMRGKKRSLYVNCFSRLWWTGYLTYDESRENPYELTEIVCNSAYASTIMLLSSSNLTAQKNNILGILASIKKRKDAGEVIKREHFVSATKYLNNMGAVTILDFLSKEDIENIIDRFFVEKYGEIKEACVNNMN